MLLEKSYFLIWKGNKVSVYRNLNIYKSIFFIDFENLMGMMERMELGVRI